MISSTSSSPGHPLPGSTVAGNRPAPSNAAQPSPALAEESLSTTQSNALESALATTPEVRPEVVARGRELAADLNYPPRVLIEKIAELITRSTDLSGIE